MSAEEKARKLAVMSSNTEWRDETRNNPVKRDVNKTKNKKRKLKQLIIHITGLIFYSTEGYTCIMPKNLTLSKIKKVNNKLNS